MAHRSSTHRILALILASGWISLGCTQVGSTGDACNNCEFETLSEHPIPVASCTLDSGELIVTCTWADEEALAAAPLTGLSASLSAWRTMDDRIPTLDNDGGVVRYDLSQTDWEPGDRVGFRVKLSASGVEGEMAEVGEVLLPFESDELERGVDIYSNYELWDVGLIADTKLATSLSFSGAIELPIGDTVVEPVGAVYRLLVDPEVGVDLRAGESLAVHLDRPGYYYFADATHATYEADPATVD